MKLAKILSLFIAKLLILNSLHASDNGNHLKDESGAQIVTSSTLNSNDPEIQENVILKNDSA